MPGHQPLELFPSQLVTFNRDGFLILDRPLVPPDAVAEVRALLDPLFDRFDQFPDTIAHDLGGPRIPGQSPLVAELEYVTILAPALLQTEAVAACRALAVQLFSRRVPIAFSHSVYKPAHSPGITAWHQDAGYDPSGRKTVAIWLALQDTDRNNGCMRYVSGSQQLGRLPHQDLPDRHGRTVTTPIDDQLVVDAVLPMGGVSAHREFALHSAGPNSSDEPRRSLILEFAPPINPKDRVRVAVHRAKIGRIRNRYLHSTH